jgi:predicted nucleic acid-binding protein
MHAVDTNVLIYAADPRDPFKQERAATTMRELETPALLWQVAAEYLSASRKLESVGFARTSAWQEIDRLRRAWTIVYPTWETVPLARDLLARYSLSFWDAMLVSACLRGGVTRLYTEDFSGYGSIDTVEVVNPFAG